MIYNRKSRIYMIKRTAFISICAVCTAIILYEGYLLYGKLMSGQASGLMAEGGARAGGATISIARAKYSMYQGELLDISKAELVEVPVELAPEGAVTSFAELNNMRLKKEIAEKEFINAADLMPETAAYEEGDRLVEHNFPEGAVPAATTVGSIMDIKLFVKGGEDPVIVSKAAVISRSNNLLSFYLNKEEQELLKEAAAEGPLFSVLYLDESQPESEVTYVPPFDMGKE